MYYSILLIIIISHLSVFVRGIHTGCQPGVNPPLYPFRQRSSLHVLDSSRLAGIFTKDATQPSSGERYNAYSKVTDYKLLVSRPSETIKSMWDDGGYLREL